MSLTPRQELFVRQYVIDRNAKQAAIRAGYAHRGARQIGHRLLTYADVANEVQRRSEMVAERLGLEQRMVLLGLLHAAAEAREQHKPEAMISAWKEIAKLCGMYPAQTRKKRDTKANEGIAAWSDAELLAWLKAREATASFKAA
jgi:phage terminase small subunit